MADYEMMITKVKNIYIMLLNAISKENISIVDHCLDDELTNKFKSLIESNIRDNIKQVFRQPNISNVYVIDENEEYITIEAETKYITYYVDRRTNKYVSGDNKTRITKDVILKVRKNSVKSKILFTCPSCGAGLKINASGICSYCGGLIDEQFSPYVLCAITCK